MTGATTMQLGLHALWLMALSAGGNSSVHVHAWRPYAPVCGPLRLAAGFCSGPAGLGLGGVTARACWRRPRTRQIAPTMAAGGSEDQWMFVDAKGLQKGAKALREIEVGVIARAFGEQLVMGDERWIEVSKAADELLLETACKQRKRVAYTVGRASTSGKFANAQGFLAGTTASLLSVREVQRRAGGTGVTSVLVRGEGRVVLQSIKAMKPSIVATALPLRDGGIALGLQKCGIVFCDAPAAKMLCAALCLAVPHRCT